MACSPLPSNPDDARLARLWAAAVGLLFLGLVVWIAPSGFFLDDLAEAGAARAATWSEILTLTPAPSLPPIALWRAAVALAPTEPYVPMRLAYAVVHVVNAALVAWLFRRWWGPTAGWLAAAVFLGLRPGGTVHLWTGAGKEALVLAFALASCVAFLSRRYTAATAASVLAMLTKPSALLVPVLWIAARRWGDGEGERLPSRGRAGLVIAVVANTGLAVNAWLRPGWWAVFDPTGGTSLVAKTNLLGSSLLRSFVAVAPERVFPFEWLGLLGLGVAAIAFVLGPPRLRFGLIWSLAFLGPAVFASGIPNPHYAYTAGVGTLVVLAVVLGRIHGALGRGTVATGIAVFLAVHGALLFRDAAAHRACNGLGNTTRARLAERPDLWCDGCALGVVNRPLWVGIPEIVRYDHGAEIELVARDACEPRGERACLAFAQRVETASECPADALEAFVVWGRP